MVVGETVKLVGFVGDYRGTKSSLTYFRPVVHIDGLNWVAMTERWTDGDLRQLAPTEYRFVQPVADLDIRRGDGVWLAGQLLVNRCVDIDGFGNRLKVWRAFRGEYRLSAGPYASFVELNHQIYAAAVRLLHRALFDPGDLGKAQRVFEVVNNLHYVDALDQQIERGLYYHELREIDRYAMVSIDAVADGLVANDADFKAAVQDRIRDLSGLRLRELVPVYRDTSSAGGDLRQSTDRALISLLERIRRLEAWRGEGGQSVEIGDLTVLRRGGHR